jgi:hypothetical protein
MRVEPKLRRSPLDFRPGVAAALATYWAVTGSRAVLGLLEATARLVGAASVACAIGRRAAGTKHALISSV